MTMDRDQERLAAEILDGFVPIGDDHPRVQEFEQAMVEHIAARPSPEAPAESQSDRIEQKLDQILTLLEGGSP